MGCDDLALPSGECRVRSAADRTGEVFLERWDWNSERE